MPNIVTFSLAFKHNLHLVTFFSLPICIVFPQFTGKFIDLFRVIGSSRILAGSKEKKQFLLHSQHFYNIILIVEMLSEN